MLCESCGSPVDESGDAFSSTVKVGKVLYCGPSCVDQLNYRDALVVLDSPIDPPVRWQSAGVDAQIVKSVSRAAERSTGFYRNPPSARELIRLFGSTD